MGLAEETEKGRRGPAFSNAFSRGAFNLVLRKYGCKIVSKEVSGSQSWGRGRNLCGRSGPRGANFLKENFPYLQNLLKINTHSSAQGRRALQHR